MRIVVDLQGAQTSASKSRGIGRYSLSLTQALVRQRGEHEIILALNGAFPESVLEIRNIFCGVLPAENICIYYPSGSVYFSEKNNEWRRRTAEFVREAFLSSLKPDMVLVTSLFEGLSDDAVTSVGMLTTSIPTACILYDLIPYIYSDIYLENPISEAWYENKLDQIRRTDLLLAISDSSRDEGIRYLGIPDEKCIAISTATDFQFRPLQLTLSAESELRQRYTITHQFVMYTGGIDYRKNIDGLIIAYSMLSKSLRSAHQLVVVCAIKNDDRLRLLNLAKKHGLTENELILTGFVSEDDLIALYNLCKLFVFPSLHEGFGLPVLEAMACGCAVITANTSSLPEVVGRTDVLFDPYVVAEIYEKMIFVLNNEDFLAELREYGVKRAELFSWDVSAKRAINAIEEWRNKSCCKNITVNDLHYRPRLAYISPLPPERSGISDYSAELLPELSRFYRVDVITTQLEITDPWIRENCTARSIDWFKKNKSKYERVLYHFGNSAFHQHMFELLSVIPGVVVLHDFYLSGVIARMDMYGYVPGLLAYELYHGHGYVALHDHIKARNFEITINKYPCNISVLNDATDIIVHSNASRSLAEQWYGKGAADWIYIPHLRAVPILNAQNREVLAFNDDDFVVCSFGLLGASKLNHRLINSWINSPLSSDPRCILVFVGENDSSEYGEKLLKLIRDSGLGNRIRITGWVDKDKYRQYLIAADLGVQLRDISKGETSGAVLDCMSYGLPTIVNANGSMADLSNDAVYKLNDKFSDLELSEALKFLLENSDRRQTISEQAKNIVRNNHAPRACAEQYSVAIERNCRTPRNMLTSKIGEIDSSLTSNGEWMALAQAIDRTLSPVVGKKQILIDVSNFIGKDKEVGGIVNPVLIDWLNCPPVDYRIEPVYICNEESSYRYARSYTLELLECPSDIFSDDVINYRSGDIFINFKTQSKNDFNGKGLFFDLCVAGVEIKSFFVSNETNAKELLLEVVAV